MYGVCDSPASFDALFLIAPAVGAASYSLLGEASATRADNINAACGPENDDGFRIFTTFTVHAEQTIFDNT